MISGGRRGGAGGWPRAPAQRNLRATSLQTIAEPHPRPRLNRMAAGCRPCPGRVRVRGRGGHDSCATDRAKRNLLPTWCRPTQRGRAPRSGRLTFCGEPVLQDLTGGAKYPYCESACVRQDAAAQGRTTASGAWRRRGGEAARGTLLLRHAAVPLARRGAGAQRVVVVYNAYGENCGGMNGRVRESV